MLMIVIEIFNLFLINLINRNLYYNHRLIISCAILRVEVESGAGEFGLESQGTCATKSLLIASEAFCAPPTPSIVPTKSKSQRLGLISYHPPPKPLNCAPSTPKKNIQLTYHPSCLSQTNSPSPTLT